MAKAKIKEETNTLEAAEKSLREQLGYEDVQKIEVLGELCLIASLDGRPVVLVHSPGSDGAVSAKDEEYVQELGAVIDDGPADYVWATTTGEVGSGYIYSWRPELDCQVSAIPTSDEIKKLGAPGTAPRKIAADPLRFKALQAEFDELHEKIYSAREPIDGSNDLTAQLCKLIFLKMHFERHPDFKVGGVEFEKVFDPDYIREHKGKAVDQIKSAFSEVKDLKEYTASDDRGECFRIFDRDDFIKFNQPSTYALVAEMLNRHHLIEPHQTGVEDDILGRAFDVMLRGKFEGKGGMGVYLTPQQVRDAMIQMAFYDIEQENAGTLTRRDPSTGKPVFHVCDPCCGSGGFLVTSMRALRKHVEKLVGLSKKQQEELLQEIYTEGFVGCDNAPGMVLLARINMALHGDPNARVFRVENSLTTEVLSPETYDLIVTNPPFKKGGIKRPDNDDILDAFLSDIDNKEPLYSGDGLALGAKPNNKGVWSSVKSIDPAVLFIDRCLQLLKPGGRLLVVLPDGILCNSGDRYVREYLMGRKDEETGKFVGGKAVVKAVVSLPPVTFRLSGAGAKTSFLYLQKKRVGDEQGAVFMAVADEVGFDVKQNKEVNLGADRNDLVAIVEAYKAGQPVEES
ncbi:MAG: N-6 DNA methylase [Verrucomicrobiae bacterium]|nr:N-6 DNA methylase [Verrucomicrobiae bacterium]